MPENKQLVQIVISKLRPDADRNRFAELTRAMKEWFLTQEGFVSYEVYESERNWADKIVWANAESAKRINKAFISSTIFKEMEQLVEPDYRGFLGQVAEL